MIVNGIGEYADPVRKYMIDGTKQAKIYKFSGPHLKHVICGVGKS